MSADTQHMSRRRCGKSPQKKMLVTAEENEVQVTAKGDSEVRVTAKEDVGHRERRRGVGHAWGHAK